MTQVLLQIENFDRLPDGGPIAMPVARAHWQVGRSPTMDWVLPDPSRMISGHHFDISFSAGDWWLTDRSTNGTYLLGSPYRLGQPHRLADMDRFQVGKYIILVRLQTAASPLVALSHQPNPANFPPAAFPDAWGSESEDPWAIGGPLPPVEVSRPRPQKVMNDFGDEFIPAPTSMPGVPSLDMQASPWPRPTDQAPKDPGFGGMLDPLPRPLPAPPQSDTPALEPSPPHAGMSLASGVSGDFMASFCAAAGLDPKLAVGVDPATFGQMLGESLRGTTEELMAQLKLRAAARKLTRSADHSTLQATANNPLKFLPGPEQALEAILFRPRAGFLSGSSAFTGALGDLRTHQVAILAAIQPALAALLADLSPDAIETAIGGKGFLASSRKQKAWDHFVAAWDARAHPHENGILDAFLALFSEAYEDAVARQQTDNGK